MDDPAPDVLAGLRRVRTALLVGGVYCVVMATVAGLALLVVPGWLCFRGSCPPWSSGTFAYGAPLGGLIGWLLVRGPARSPPFGVGGPRDPNPGARTAWTEVVAPCWAPRWERVAVLPFCAAFGAHAVLTGPAFPDAIGPFDLWPFSAGAVHVSFSAMGAHWLWLWRCCRPERVASS